MCEIPYLETNYIFIVAVRTVIVSALGGVALTAIGVKRR